MVSLRFVPVSVAPRALKSKTQDFEPLSLTSQIEAASVAVAALVPEPLDPLHRQSELHVHLRPTRLPQAKPLDRLPTLSGVYRCLAREKPEEIAAARGKHAT